MIKKFTIITIFLITAANFTVSACNISINDELKENNMTFYNEDVPIWQVDDYWIYNIQTLNLQVFQSGTQINLNLGITDFKTRVDSVTDSTYSLELSGKVRGSFSFDKSGELFGGDFILTKMSGDMQVKKLDLSALSFNVIIKTFVIIKQNPLGIPLPLILTITMSLVHSSPRPFIDFPLYDGKSGIISEVSPNIEIKVESFIFKILNMLNPDIPSEIIVPFVINGPMIPYIVNQEIIIIKPGTFNAYNVNLGLGYIGNLYYTPDVGNIVKTYIDFNIPGQYKITLNAELNKYIYQ